VVEGNDPPVGSKVPDGTEGNDPPDVARVNFTSGLEGTGVMVMVLRRLRLSR